MQINKIIYLTLLIHISFCLSLDTLSTKQYKDPNVALTLSLLPLLNLSGPDELGYIPSLGQLYNGKPLKSFILSFLKSYWLIDYEKSKKGNNIKDRNRSLWWLFILILYGSIDAYVDAHLDKFPNDEIIFKKLVKEKKENN